MDCGEGTQRQMALSATGMGHVGALLVTHCHPDHVLGIPGLLATWSEAREAPLLVAGPAGLADLMMSFRRHHGELAFPMEVREMSPGEEVRRDGYRLRAVGTRHTVPSVAWALEEDARPGHLDAGAARARGALGGRDLGALAAGHDVVLGDGSRIAARDVVGPPLPGRRVVVTGDTAPCPEVEDAARGADVLVHEATFLRRDGAIAARSLHSTAAGAAALAHRAGVRMLVLTHLSHRYTSGEIVLEAREMHPGAVVPADLDAVAVPLPEHGPPRHVPGGGAPSPPSRGVDGP